MDEPGKTGDSSTKTGKNVDEPDKTGDSSTKTGKIVDEKKNDLQKGRSFYNKGVDDGARTHDTRNHNPMLYQLNYIHHVRDCKGTKKIVPCKQIPENYSFSCGISFM